MSAETPERDIHQYWIEEGVYLCEQHADELATILGSWGFRKVWQSAFSISEGEKQGGCERCLLEEKK